PSSSAPQSPGSWLSGAGMMLPLLLMMAVLFFLTRSDKKKRQDVEAKLKKGDRVITRSGLIGKISEVTDRHVRLEIAAGVTVTMLKNAVEGPDGGDTVATKPADKPAEKSDKSDKPEKSEKEPADKDKKK